MTVDPRATAAHPESSDPADRAPATISVDLDSVDVHLRGYGHAGLPFDPLVHRVALPRLLELFAGHRVAATFFVLARDARTEVEALRRIRDAGHEIASHGIDHLPGIARRSAAEIVAELDWSRKTLEAVVGTRVVGFRAPDWSAGPRLVPALAAAHYEYDASLVPSPILTAGHAWLAVRGRRPGDILSLRPPASLKREPFRWTVGGASTIEFPLAVSPRVRMPLYHTLRPSIDDASFEAHLDGFVRRGETLSYALHGVDALGLREDGVNARLRVHPGMGSSLDAKVALLERTIAAIAARFSVRTFADRTRAIADADARDH